MNQENAATEGSRIDLRNLYSLLWRQKWTVVAVMAAVLATALLLSSRQTRLYGAQSSVLVEAPPGSAAQDAPVMATEKLVASSPAVANIVEDTLHLADPPDRVLQGLSVSVPVDSQILVFSYSHHEPRVAQQRAQVFAESYLAFRKQKVIDASLASHRALQDQIKSLRKSLDDVQRQAALGLGIGVVLLRQYVGDRIQGAKDLESCVGAPVLSAIPAVRARGVASARLVTVQRPTSPVAEAFRHLRANFLVAAGSCAAKTILITSALEEEGKTFTAANLGVALANAGNAVILLSADLRRPTLEQVFGVSAPAGLANALEKGAQGNGTSPVSEMWSVQANLTIIPVGSAPDNPAELLTSSNMLAFIEKLRKFADFVLIDAAPLLPVADAATVAPACDAVLIVADARSTRRATVVEARQQLDRIHAPVLGAVLVNAWSNGVKSYQRRPRRRPPAGQKPYGQKPDGQRLLAQRHFRQN